MLDRPRPLLAAALLLMAGLTLARGDAPALPLAPAEAAAHEGQESRVAGVVVAARPWGDGLRVDLAQDGHALPVLLERTGEVPALGEWAEAGGRLARTSGLLVLGADRFRAVPGPAPAEPSWDALAHDPEAWSGRLLRLSGRVEGGDLRDGAGHSLRTGAGPWPDGGPATATGTLAWDPACLCHRFHAGRIVPWSR